MININETISNEEKAINDIVERYLKDDLVNCKFIPDFIEKRLYRNILKILTGVLKDTIENAEVEVLGHRIKFSITPIETKKNEESEILSHYINNDFVTMNMALKKEDE